MLDSRFSESTLEKDDLPEIMIEVIEYSEEKILRSSVGEMKNRVTVLGKESDESAQD